MKLEIKKTVTKTEIVSLNLKLEKGSDSTIDVVATNGQGAEMVLVGFTKKGQLILYRCISENFGLNLNDDGELIPNNEENEEED